MTYSLRSSSAVLHRRRGRFRIEDRLDDAFPVPQVDKDQAAVVAAAVHPAGQGHFGADMFFSERTAGMCPEQDISLINRGFTFDYILYS